MGRKKGGHHHNFGEKELQQIEDLGKLGCKISEVASIMKCSPDSIEKDYREHYDAGFNDMKKSLRRKQIELAMAGNATMLVWLGKQYLDQTDKQETLDRTPRPIVIEKLDGSETILTTEKKKS